MEPNKKDTIKIVRNKIDKIKNDTLDKEKCKEMAKRLIQYIKQGTD